METITEYSVLDKNGKSIYNGHILYEEQAIAYCKKHNGYQVKRCVYTIFGNHLLSTAIIFTNENYDESLVVEDERIVVKLIADDTNMVAAIKNKTEEFIYFRIGNTAFKIIPHGYLPLYRYQEEFIDELRRKKYVYIELVQ